METNKLIKCSMDKRVREAEPSAERYDEILQNIFAAADKKSSNPIRTFINRIKSVRLNLPIRDTIEVIIFIAVLLIIPALISVNRKPVNINPAYLQEKTDAKGGTDTKSSNDSSNGKNSVENSKEVDKEPATNKEDIRTFHEENFGFFVDFPKSWDHKIEKYIEPSEFHNGSPDAGIIIYLENNTEDSIYVLGMVSYFNIPHVNEYKKESFTTTSGLSGDLFTKDTGETIDLHVSFDKAYIGAVGSISKENYNKHKIQIMDILKSIRKE